MKPATNNAKRPNAPISRLDEWEDFLKTRYPEEKSKQSQIRPFQAVDPNKKKEEFRNYEADARASVREFYRLNDRYQTYDFAQKKREEFLSSDSRTMSSEQAM